jgi:hypothetical protein
MYLTIASCSYRILFIFAVMHRHLKISMEVREKVPYCGSCQPVSDADRQGAGQAQGQAPTTSLPASSHPPVSPRHPRSAALGMY